MVTICRTIQDILRVMITLVTEYRVFPFMESVNKCQFLAVTRLFHNVFTYTVVPVLVATLYKGHPLSLSDMAKLFTAMNTFIFPSPQRPSL